MYLWNGVAGLFPSWNGFVSNLPAWNGFFPFRTYLPPQWTRIYHATDSIQFNNPAFENDYVDARDALTTLDAHDDLPTLSYDDIDNRDNVKPFEEEVPTVKRESEQETSKLSEWKLALPVSVLLLPALFMFCYYKCG